jgi:hypothetical protein
MVFASPFSVAHHRNASVGCKDRRASLIFFGQGNQRREESFATCVTCGHVPLKSICLSSWDDNYNTKGVVADVVPSAI